MGERPVVLIGMMGVGKSAVGRALARRIGRPFVDGDDAVVARDGRPIARIFAEDGEDAFRDLEARVLAGLLDRHPPVVLAAGGGIVVRAENRRLLRDRASVIWLRAPVEELAERVGSGAGRPLLADDPLATLRVLERQRAPWYAEVAEVVLDTAHRRPEQLSDELVGLLGIDRVGER